MQWPWELCFSNPFPSLMFPCSGLSIKQGSFLCAEMLLGPHGPDMPSMWSEEQIWKGPQKSPNPLPSSRKKQEAQAWHLLSANLLQAWHLLSLHHYCVQQLFLLFPVYRGGNWAEERWSISWKVTEKYHSLDSKSVFLILQLMSRLPWKHQFFFRGEN